MKKMLPTRRTFLLGARFRLDTPRRRHMTNKLRERFAERAEAELWAGQAESGRGLFVQILHLLGLTLPEANYHHQADNVELIRSLRRTRKQVA